MWSCLSLSEECGACSAAQDEDEVNACVERRSETVSVSDLEAYAKELSLSLSSSYEERRAALFRVALMQSKLLNLQVEASSPSFPGAWRAFNALSNRSELSSEWTADDVIPRLQSAERPRASVPMPRLMSCACVEASLDTGGNLVFVISAQVSTRREVARRPCADLHVLDAKLKAFKLTLPPLPQSQNQGGSVLTRLTRALSSTSSPSSKSARDGQEEEEERHTEPAFFSPSPNNKSLRGALEAVTAYLSAVMEQLALRGLYSEELFDFLGVDDFARRRLHCEDLKLMLRELQQLTDEPSEDFAVAIDWEDSWLAFLRTDTNYYPPPGPVKNAKLAATMAEHAVHRQGDISDEYVLHSPAKWHFLTTVYGPADVTLRLPRPPTFY